MSQQCVSHFSVIETNASMASGDAESKPTFWSARAMPRFSPSLARTSAVADLDTRDDSAPSKARIAVGGIVFFFFAACSPISSSAGRLRIEESMVGEALSTRAGDMMSGTCASRNTAPVGVEWHQMGVVRKRIQQIQSFLAKASKG